MCFIYNSTSWWILCLYECFAVDMTAGLLHFYLLTATFFVRHYAQMYVVVRYPHPFSHISDRDSIFAQVGLHILWGSNTMGWPMTYKVCKASENIPYIRKYILVYTCVSVIRKCFSMENKSSHLRASVCVSHIFSYGYMFTGTVGLHVWSQSMVRYWDRNKFHCMEDM